MAIETFELVGPAHWASYLVNGDASSLEADDVEKANAWLAREGASILSTKDDEEWFTWSMGLHCPELGAAGCHALTYIATPRAEG